MNTEHLQDLLLSQEPKLHHGRTLLRSLRGAHHGASRGVIPTLPQLIISKINNPDPTNKLWTSGIDTLTNECIFPDMKGKYTAPGEYVLMTFHGEGIATKQRIHHAMQTQYQDQRYVKLEENDYNTLLDGVLPSGKTFPIFTLDDIGSEKIDIFKPHAIIQPCDNDPTSAIVYCDLNTMLKNPVQLARLSGAEKHFKEYFELAKDYDDQMIYNLMSSSTLYNYPHCRTLRVEMHRTGFNPRSLYQPAAFSSLNSSAKKHNQ